MMLFLVSSMSIIAQEDLPEKPLLNYVSADTSDHTVLISWNPSATPGIQYYKIYSLNVQTFPVTGTFIDSVPGSTLQYKHMTDPGNPLIYTVTAVDAVGESLLSGDYHQAIKLDASYDSCRQEMDLEWTKYYGWGGKLTGYRILCNDGSGTFTDVALLDTINLSYTYTGVQENTNYEYIIKAFDNQGRSSLSHLKTYFTYMPPPPSYLNLDYVTVLDDRTLEISFSTDLEGEIDDFQLMRSTESGVVFTKRLALMDVIQSPYSLNDEVATQGIINFYRIDALNSCQDPILSSNVASNILLTGEIDGTIAKISWNPYLEYAGGVEGYAIYRMNPYDELELITTAAPEAVSYIEDLLQIGQESLKGEIHYQVEAIEADGNPYGVKGRSSSNILTLNVETQLFVPNAFSPNDDGMNDTFGPVMDFTPSAFRMLIYDRTGKMLFQTTDPYEGWDGTLNGSTMARQGVYIYHIEYTSYSGVRKVLTGNLSLVNP